MIQRFSFAVVVGLIVGASLSAAEPAPLKLLFLGDNGHHKPAERFRQLQPVLAKRGIDLVYSDKTDSLDPKILAAYDGLVVYANHEKITPEQEKALLDYVEGGKGFVPLHCASYCFLNSPKYIDLVGAQFKSHNDGTFRTTIIDAEHPVMKGFKGFESWDETYVHTKHNETDRTVLEVREERGTKEPWTWVRNQGQGRVFYTAWGHDERTWGNPGFQNLVERGIRWVCGQDPTVAGSPAAVTGGKPEMTKIAKDLKPFEYVEANVPFYAPRGGAGQPLKKMQKPLSPQESMKHIVHPVQLELKLFVSEPDLGGKPICMNWDERGRLWVALSIDYPNELQREGQGRDKIVICEDADGDGKCDKITTFADKLSIPTSFTFSRGGVVVHQAPQTLFLKDADGDGKADERKVLFAGWSTGDTHAGPSNLRYGLDNHLYGIVGYAGFNGTVGEQRHRFGQAFYRLTPDGSKLEVLRNTNNNSWGVGFSEEGLLFGSTANGCPSVYLPIPNRYYESVRGWSSSVLGSIATDNHFEPVTDKVRQVDWHGGFTAAAGHALYTARQYPKEYWNRTAFVAEPTGHLAATMELLPNGTDFKARYGWNLLAADDEWVAPTMAEVGPDGNVWVIDWYNFIVQHNPKPPGFEMGKGNAYETELRDKKHARIYRLVAKDAGDAKRFTLDVNEPARLLKTLANDNMFWRLHAQRLLVERGQLDVLPELVKLAGDAKVDEIGLNAGAIHALWTMHGLGGLDGSKGEATAAAVAALKHKSAGVRRNAALVLPRNEEGRKALLGSGALADADAHVRLAALLALAEMPADSEAGAAVAVVLSKPENTGDRWIPDAATSAAAAHDVGFLKAVAAGKTVPAQKGLDVIAVVAEHYGRGGPTATAGQLVASLAEAEPKVADAVLAGLGKGWPRGKAAELNDETEEGLAKLLGRVSAGGKGNLVKLATTWGSKAFEKYGEEIAATMLKTVGDEKATDEQRVTAAKQLVEFRPADDKVVEQVLGTITIQSSPPFAAGMLEALGGSTSPSVGPSVIKNLAGWPPSTKAAAVRVLLSRPDSTRVFLDVVEKGEAQLADLSLDQKQALASHPDRQIAQRAKKLLEKGGGLPSADRQKVIEEMKPLLAKDGDAKAGKAAFTKHCAACHSHGGEGGKVAPDLTGMAVHPKEHLLTDIIDPSRDVEGNFRVYTLTTTGGKVLTGLLASETKTSVELIDAQAKKVVVLREDIDTLTQGTKSLMPEGFEKTVTPGELTDLLTFLTQRGKYLPLPLDKAATVVSTKGMFYDEAADGERLIFRDWTPKTFKEVPFYLVDPQGDRVPNAILLYGPQGRIPPKMPKSVTVPCNAPAKVVHMLSGVGGWCYPYNRDETVSMIVRLHYADGKTEDHELKNGVHFADYIGRADVKGSEFAFALRRQQIRYLTVMPKRADVIAKIEFVKGPDGTAPVVMAVTVEAP